MVFLLLFFPIFLSDVKAGFSLNSEPIELYVTFGDITKPTPIEGFKLEYGFVASRHADCRGDSFFPEICSSEFSIDNPQWSSGIFLAGDVRTGKDGKVILPSQKSPRKFNVGFEALNAFHGKLMFRALGMPFSYKLEHDGKVHVYECVAVLSINLWEVIMAEKRLGEDNEVRLGKDRLKQVRSIRWHFKGSNQDISDFKAVSRSGVDNLATNATFENFNLWNSQYHCQKL